MFAARLLSAVLLLGLAAHAAATPPLQEQMTPEEFRQAGLDKLDAQELAALNRWLDRHVESSTSQAIAQAREEGRQEVVRQSRGFFDFGSSEPIESTLEGEFRGFRVGQRYRLANGQVWEQIEPATLAGVRRSDPAVRIIPGMFNAWWLQVDRYNTRAKVRRVE